MATDFLVAGVHSATVEVDGLDVNLAEGTYWLGVAPNASGDLVWATTGANGVGSPLGARRSLVLVLS